MDDAPERIWAELDGDSILVHNGNPDLEALIYTGYLHEYVRADLYHELKTKVEVATKALDDIVIDSTWGLEHETYMRCRVALRQLKEDN